MESIGEQLKALREEKKLTREQVAQAMHVKAEHIQEIEEDQIQHTLGYTYAKGYIRSFCSVIDCDSTPFIERFNAENAPPKIKQEQTKIEMLSGRNRQTRPVWPRVTGTLVIIALAFYLVWNYWGFWNKFIKEKTAPAPTETTTPATIEQPADSAETAALTGITLWLKATDNVSFKVFRDELLLAQEYLRSGQSSQRYTGQTALILEISNGSAIILYTPQGTRADLPAGPVKVQLDDQGLTIIPQNNATDSAADTE